MPRTPSERCDVPAPFAADRRKASRRQSRTNAGWLAGITKEVLADTAKLMALFQTAADLPVDNYALQRNVIALAVHVMSSKGVHNPVGTFIAKIRKRDWSTINDADDDEAVRRHRRWLGQQEPQPMRKGESTTEPMLVGDVLRAMILLMD